MSTTHVPVAGVPGMGAAGGAREYALHPIVYQVRLDRVEEPERPGLIGHQVDDLLRRRDARGAVERYEVAVDQGVERRVLVARGVRAGVVILWHRGLAADHVADGGQAIRQR